MILQKASSQHIFRLLWCSGRSPEEHLDGSTSQFSSDSYRALINSPGKNKINLCSNQHIKFMRFHLIAASHQRHCKVKNNKAKPFVGLTLDYNKSGEPNCNQPNDSNQGITVFLPATHFFTAVFLQALHNVTGHWFQKSFSIQFIEFLHKVNGWFLHLHPKFQQCCGEGNVADCVTQHNVHMP